MSGHPSVGPLDIKLCKHMPRVKYCREVVDIWTNGCISKHLVVPLKDWSVQTRDTEPRKLYSDRKRISK